MKKKLCKALHFIFLNMIVFFSGTSALYAQNGIPVNELKKNPYFQNDAEENAQKRKLERERKASQVQQKNTSDEDYDEDEYYGYEEEEKENTQFSNPDDYNTFYNSKNWFGADPTPFKYPDEMNKSNSKGGVSIGEEKEKTPVYMEGDPLLTDAEKRGRFPWLPFDESMFMIEISYNPNYVISSDEKDLSYYFNLHKFYGFDLVGAGIKAEYLPYTRETFALGVGVNFYWNLLWNKTEFYKIVANQFMPLASLSLKFLIRDINLIELRINGGLLSLSNVKIVYSSGAIPDKKVWNYPVAGAGIEMATYFSRNWSVGLSADYNWTFLIDKPYSFVRIGINSGWRF